MSKKNRSGDPRKYSQISKHLQPTTIYGDSCYDELKSKMYNASSHDFAHLLLDKMYIPINIKEINFFDNKSDIASIIFAMKRAIDKNEAINSGHGGISAFDFSLNGHHYHIFVVADTKYCTPFVFEKDILSFHVPFEIYDFAYWNDLVA